MICSRSWAVACAFIVLSAAGSALAQPAPEAVKVEDFVRYDEFESARISPTGEYLAFTVPLGDRTALAMLRLSDMKLVGGVRHDKTIHIAGFEWVGPERVVYAIGERFDELEAPRPTGELYAANVDGNGAELLVGFRAGGSTPGGTHLNKRKPEMVFATLIDPIPEDPKHALISTRKITGGESTFTQVEKMDVVTGNRVVVARSPVTEARFWTDHAHEVRFALGQGLDNVDKLYYRAGRDSEWQLLADEAESGRRVVPVGFSSDDKTAYLLSEETSGPGALYAFDVATQEMKQVARDDNSDVHAVLLSPFDRSVFGVAYMDGKPRFEYLEPNGELARLHRSLQAGFPGQTVLMGDALNRSRGLLLVHSDRNPGDLYLFDYAAKKAQYLIPRNKWIDPERMAKMEVVDFTAPDGLALDGYLTLPSGKEGRNLPMVVYPHGGPIDIQDVWGYDTAVQLLASRGYAVLQVNFRGSSGHGRAFLEAGYRQWGDKMPEDIAAGVRWAIAEGIADPRRICIYGASYGAYAALMGAVREPDLYRCAVGHVGVYDLRLLYSRGDTRGISNRTYFEAVMGKEEGLASISPNLLADRIKVPVLLTAGREDERAPPVHTERMRDALNKAGGSVETVIYDGEGHGFFVEANRVDVFRRLLAFLDRHIGSQPQSAKSP